MKVVLRNLREVRTPKMGPCVRFSITLAEDDGEPLMTCEGFLYNRERMIFPPSTRTKFSTRPVTYTKLAPEFQERLKKVLEEMPGVKEILGPVPPPMEEEAVREIEGEAKVAG